MLPKFLLDDIDMLCIMYHTNGTTKDTVGITTFNSVIGVDYHYI